MRYGSLFSGYGGLDLAVEEVFGAKAAWHAEIEPSAVKVLERRWPGVPNLGDVSAVNWAGVEPVEIMCGGFPCTDLSSAGKQAGLGAGDAVGAVVALRRRDQGTPARVGDHREREGTDQCTSDPPRA